MLEKVDTEAAPTESDNHAPTRWQSPRAALISALIPGLGQLALGEKRKAALFFALDASWVLLFFLPLRLPDYYGGWLSLIVWGCIVAITASCEALQSKSPAKNPGSLLWLLIVLPAALVAAFLAQAIVLPLAGFRDFRVSSNSMEQAVREGDLIMADMRSYRHHEPSREDIVLLKNPNTPGVILIKRLIAKGGDTIMSQKGTIWINGSILNEPYVEHTGDAPDELMNFGPVTIPPHKLFVMGDDHDISLDSRVAEFGLLDDSVVLGKALYVINAAHDRSGERIH